MTRQRELATSMGMEISIRFLAVLEDLVKDPSIGIHYKVHEDGELKVLPANMVSGIFSAILMRYQTKCDWTPLADARARIQQLERELAELSGGA